MSGILISEYLAGAVLLGEAIAELSQVQLNAKPVTGTWSIQQIVWHMVDSDLIHGDRMKRTIAEDEPLLIGFNETKFAEKLHYDELDAAVGCELFRLNRQQLAEIFKRLPPDAWKRTARHNEVGLMTLSDLVQKAIRHLNHHLSFIAQKRQLVAH